jgi:pyroglutamyl-peptidase
MSVILLTGFEPWHDFPVNSSWEVASRFDRRQIAGFTIAARRLPVSYGRLPRALGACLEEVEPDICIALGMEPRGTALRLERVAVNVADAADYPDNDGAAPRDGAVVAGGPAAYFAGLPLRQVADALGRAQLPARLSLSAGAFLCNACFYRLMHAAAEDRPGMVAGFVHVPPLLDTLPGSEGWPVERLQRAVAVVIETTVKEIGNIHLRDVLA